MERAMLRVLTVAVMLMLGAAVANAAPSLVARVDISRQLMTVYQDGHVAYSWRVSTAGRGYRTPLGSYRPTRLHPMWYSRKI